MMREIQLYGGQEEPEAAEFEGGTLQDEHSRISQASYKEALTKPTNVTLAQQVKPQP